VGGILSEHLRIGKPLPASLRASSRTDVVTAASVVPSSDPIDNTRYAPIGLVHLWELLRRFIGVTDTSSDS